AGPLDGNRAAWRSARGLRAVSIQPWCELPRWPARSLLGKNLVVALRRFGAAAEIDGVLRIKAKTLAELHQQLVAALDRDHGATGFDANLGVARAIFFQAAGGNLDHAQLGIDGDGFLAEQAPGEQLSGDLADRQREVGARGVNALDVFGAVDARDHRHVGR